MSETVWMGKSLSSAGARRHQLARSGRYLAVAVLLIGAQVAASPVRTKASSKQARVIALDETQARVFHSVYTHPSIPAILEFPEPFAGTPSCGDCVDGSSPPEVLNSSQALFLFDFFPADQYLSIKPIQHSKKDGGVVPDEHFITTVTVRLASKLTVTVKVHYGSVRNADPRVVFTLPRRGEQDAYVAAQVEKRHRELEAAFADRLSSGVREAFMSALASPHECVTPGGRAREGNIVLELVEMCRFSDELYVRFHVDNRLKAEAFEIDRVAVARRVAKEYEPIHDVVEHLPNRDVRWPKAVVGVVSFPLTEQGGEYALTVFEKGGQSRKVIIQGFGF